METENEDELSITRLTEQLIEEFCRFAIIPPPDQIPFCYLLRQRVDPSAPPCREVTSEEITSQRPSNRQSCRGSILYRGENRKDCRHFAILFQYSRFRICRRTGEPLQPGSLSESCPHISECQAEAVTGTDGQWKPGHALTSRRFPTRSQRNRFR